MTYFGLCIGGPLDGQYRNWNTKQFDVPNKTPDLSAPIGSEGCDAADQTITVTTYELSPWRVPNAAPGEAYDLWIPSDCTVTWAISRIHNAYHLAKAQERRANHSELIEELQEAFTSLDPFNQKGAVEHPHFNQKVGNDEASSVRLRDAIEEVTKILEQLHG